MESVVYYNGTKINITIKKSEDNGQVKELDRTKCKRNTIILKVLFKLSEDG